MSERPIAVGDLVQVVRGSPCCGSLQSLGRIFKVVEIRTVHRHWCVTCNTVFRATTARSHIDPVDGLWWAYEVQILKRIPPLSELESTDETIKETA